jgi:thiol-disulfide isomerase/thioredoxin
LVTLFYFNAVLNNIMNKLKTCVLTLLLIGFLTGCKNLSGDYTRLVIHTSAPLNSRLYVDIIPFNNEKAGIVDSAVIKNNRDSIILYIPKKTERLLKIIVKGERLSIVFINDAPVIRVHADYFSNKYTITGSKATTSLKNFNDNQLVKANELRKINQGMDSLKIHHIKNRLSDSLTALFNHDLQSYFKQYKIYADTVSSPAAFMAADMSIDFGDDYKASKKFILHASARFPHYEPLQSFTKEVLATIRIYEEEFYIGDKLPPITLPDIDNKTFSTSTLNNQYYLIDFWSTLCGQCIMFKVAEMKIADKIPSDKLQIVSVALDDQKDEWKKIIYGNKYNWKQLIDVKMWQGPAVRTLLFDSIPFNFLVGPHGKIIDKAIKPDSLQKVISRLRLN